MVDKRSCSFCGTDIEPGTYTISNLVASETEKTSILWVCEKEVKAVDLAMRGMASASLARAVTRSRYRLISA